MPELRLTERLPLLALIFGAIGIAFAPIFAKLAVLADQSAGAGLLSPAAVAFWRMFLAAPFFIPSAWRGRRSRHGELPRHPELSRHPEQSEGPRSHLALLLPGFFFAADLGIWHWSFEFTSVANATLEANFAVVLVALVSWRWLKEPLTPIFALGALLALAGMARLVGASFGGGGDAWIGDIMGIWVAFAYAAYQISTKVLLARYRVATVMAWACLGAALFLGIVAPFTPGHFAPVSANGWLNVIALTLVSQVFGQGLIVYGLSRVPAGFAAVVLILQPVVAAGLGWLMLGQALSTSQALSGVAVLAGIYLARLGSRGR